MLLKRYGTAAVALLGAGALFAVGFALGSDGHGEPPAPKRASGPDGATAAIDSLRRARSIPSLRERESRDGASPAADTNAGASAPGGDSAVGSGGASTRGSTGNTPGAPVGGGTEPPQSEPATEPPPTQPATEPPPNEPPPVRRKSTE